MPIFYVDGESRGNEQNSLPRNARIAIAYSESSVQADTGKLRIYWQPIGDRTNNEAEYYALVKALAMIAEKWADKTTGRIQSGFGHILISSDSQLVVYQASGEWRGVVSKVLIFARKRGGSLTKLGSARIAGGSR